jgi:SAM-dependent methyltransferase
VDNATAERLLELNRQFYQTFALQFSATRRRLQPGVQRLLGLIETGQHILDLGCGNGELARRLLRLHFRGTYTGLDLSPELLAEARGSLSQQVNFAFMEADLAAPDWSTLLQTGGFGLAVAFAVLHHLPGHSLRRRVLDNLHGLLSPAGLFLHSEWQFLNSARLRGRLQPWRAAGLSPDLVDPGDYLLDWREGGPGLRYVHHFSEAELDRLAQETRFKVNETFYSDGQEGRLGLYQIWERV